MSLTTTLIVLAASLAVFGVGLWRDRRPVDPMRPRLLPYTLIMLVAIITALVMAGHLLGYLTGR